MLSLLLAICLILTMVPSVNTGYAENVEQASYYVDPAIGSDANDGTSGSPFQSIAKAREAVREINSNMTGDILVYLRGGTYALTEELVFNETDSGTNGHNIIYQAYPGEHPLISGGQSIANWSLYDAANNIYKASVGTVTETRQLYVNGKRAVRARSEAGLPGTLGNLKTGAVNTGFTTTDLSITNWGNIGDIEMVYASNFVSQRATIQSVAVNAGKAEITMKQPAWANQQGRVGDRFPLYYENAYELLDAEGEWYLDRTGAVDSSNGAYTFYYKPRTGEDLTEAQVIAPTLEQFITLEGSSLDTPVHNIQFQGIDFQYSTYLRPGSNLGLNGNQSNILSETVTSPNKEDKTLVPGIITLKTAQAILFERCNFSKLGGSAINMVYGSQDNLVRGSTFVDISGSGIQVGNIFENNEEDNNPINSKALLRNNDILNNYFERMAVDFPSAVAIFAAHPVDMDISNNEIYNMPYSGITTGWNWGAADSSDRNTNITNNYIHDVMLTMDDGGAIYHLGTSYDLSIAGNYIDNQVGNYGAVYLDNGTTWATVENNVFKKVPAVAFVNPSAEYNVYRNNYTDSLGSADTGRFNSIEELNYIKDGSWPQEAVDIMDNAGIQAQYQDIIPAISGDPAPEPTPIPAPEQVEFAGKTAWITGFINATQLRNNYVSNMGSKITVGSNNITVTALGRVFIPGNKGLHNLILTDEDKTTKVADVWIDMESAPSNGAFRYVQLAQPVTLQANRIYYLTSSEGMGDQWFTSGLKLRTTSAAIINGSVFKADFGTSNGGDTFVGLDFLYETGGTSTPAPVALPTLLPVYSAIPEVPPVEVTLPVDLDHTQGFISEVAPGTLRNDWSGWAGMKITIGANPIAVKALGRYAASDSTENHRLRIVDATRANPFLEVASTVVNMEGSADGQFKYASLPSPVLLEAGKSYYILSEEAYGKDYWYDGDLSVQSGSSAASIISNAYKTNQIVGSNGAPYVAGGYGTGNSLVGVDFRYTTDTAAASRDNIVYNGDFETGVSGYIPYNARVFAENVITHNGSAGSARIDVTANTGTVRQAVYVEKNKTYEVSVWARMSVGTATGVFRLAHPQGYNPGTGYVVPVSNVLDTTWRQYKGLYKFVGTNPLADGVLEFLVQNPTGTPGVWSYYIDDLTIKEVPDVLGNGNFETQPPSSLTSGIPLWTISGATFTRETSSAITLNGSKGSGKVEMKAANGKVAQPVLFEKGKEYTVSVWVKLAAGTNTAQIVIDPELNGVVNKYLPTTAASVDTTWRQLTGSYTYTGNTPKEVANVSIRIGDGTQLAVYYFDDFVIEPVLEASWPSNAALTVSEVTASELSLNWPAASGNVSEYRVLKNNFPLATVVDAVYNSSATVATDVYSYRVTGLNDNTLYDFMVQAKDSRGNWTTLNNPVITAKTLDTSAPKWPYYSTLRVSNIEASSLLLSWTPAADLSGIASYKISMNGQELGTVSGTVYNFDVSGLSASGLYTFSVQALDSQGFWSSNGPSVTVNMTDH